jgi:hypothetical protein
MGIHLGNAPLQEALDRSPDAQPPSLYGADMPHITATYGLTEMLAAGVYWLRPLGVSWSAVQPQKNQPPDWSILASLEQEIQNASSQGAQVILRVQSTPDWAQAVPGVYCGPILQAELPAFGDFMFALVDRYKSQVKVWELWNEPDVDPGLVPPNSQFGCWGDASDPYYGGEYFAEMLQAVYPRIKAADPQAQVLVGGLLLDCDPNRVCPQDASTRFLEGILLNQGGDYFDGVSFHAYDYYLGAQGQYFNSKWQSSWNTTGPVGNAKAEYIKSVIEQAGFPNKLIMNTEAAIVCDSGCDSVFESTKANYLAQSYAGAFSSNLRANLWYSTRANFRNTDLFGPGLVPLPAYYAYKFSQAQLYNAEYIGKLRGIPGVTGYEFRRSDCPTPGEFCRVWVIWSLDGSSHTIELPDTPYAVYDVDGDALSNTINQEISLETRYIHLPPAFSIRLPELMTDFRRFDNGDFESGVDFTGNPAGWSAYSGGGQGLAYRLVSANPTYPTVDADIPQGNYSMLLGSPDYPCRSDGVPLGYAAVEQTFTVPLVPDGQSLHLNFDYVIYTWDGGSSDAYDRFEVFIDDSVTNRLVFFDGRAESSVACANWYRLPSAGWQTANVDLLSPVDYRGKTVRLVFQNWNRTDHWYNTFTYLDNVELTIGN